jgi:two-component system CheB/CheR fusion protein
MPVGLILVDRRYDIQLINNAARRMLGIHGAAMGDDLIHMAQSGSARELRRIIDDMFRTDAESSGWIEAGELSDGVSRVLRVSCFSEPANGEQYATVVLEDVTDATSHRQQLEQSLDEQLRERRSLEGQIERLLTTNQSLLEANEELTIMNAQLRSENEELLVGYEEVQSAMEEIETLNEELQATNEELETLNEELQATIEELNTTNEDLQARSGEMQELAYSLEAQQRSGEIERARLSAILSTMGDAILVVDQEGQPIHRNEAYNQTLGGAGVRLIHDGGHPLQPEEAPAARAARGEQFRMTFKVERSGKEIGTFEAIGHPIITEGAVEGGVIVMRDITHRVKGESTGAK